MQRLHFTNKRIIATLEAWDDYRTHIDSFFYDAGMSPDDRISFLVAVEEMCTNIIFYALKDKDPTSFEIEIISEVFQNADKLVAQVTLVDSGDFFDPTSQSLADLKEKAKKQKIGGWGIYLARTKSSDMHYQRIDGHNHVTLVLNYQPTGGKTYELPNPR